MICKPCADGAAADGEVRRDLLHRQCIGCPCQHRDPARRPLLPPVVKRRPAGAVAVDVEPVGGVL